MDSFRHNIVNTEYRTRIMCDGCSFFFGKIMYRVRTLHTHTHSKKLSYHLNCKISNCRQLCTVCGLWSVEAQSEWKKKKKFK